MEPRLPPGAFYGEKVQSCEVSSLLLTDYCYPPHLQVPRHSHEHAYFCLVLQGTYTEVYGKRERGCIPLSLIFHPPGEVHSDQFHRQGGRVFGVEVSAHWQERIEAYSSLLRHSAELQGGKAAWIALRLYEEFRRMDGLSPLAMEGLALELIVEASRSVHRSAEPTPPLWLQQVRERLHAQFAETLSLDELASAAGVHPMHLIRAFRQHHRCTIGDYVRRLRVDFAARRLAGSDSPLVEIALEAGFCDQSQFTKTFKQSTGLTPSQFRNTARSR
ncbi:MAG TPA: AraC family transcriptional regulator [Chthonomonadaceae bacterium]|nr:AraC family transcriptional regulator [Chthonomonadaceae bacterium]